MSHQEISTMPRPTAPMKKTSYAYMMHDHVCSVSKKSVVASRKALGVTSAHRIRLRMHYSCMVAWVMMYLSFYLWLHMWFYFFIYLLYVYCQVSTHAWIQSLLFVTENVLVENLIFLQCDVVLVTFQVFVDMTLLHSYQCVWRQWSEFTNEGWIKPMGQI